MEDQWRSVTAASKVMKDTVTTRQFAVVCARTCITKQGQARRLLHTGMRKGQADL